MTASFIQIYICTYVHIQIHIYLTALYSTRGRQLKHALFKGGEIRTAIRFLPKACTTADCCDLYGLQKAPAASCSSTGVCSKAASPILKKI